jgi:hypothetical protein
LLEDFCQYLVLSEISEVQKNSEMAKKHSKTIDWESAYEILNDKIRRKEKEEEKNKEKAAPKTRRSTRREKSTLEQISENTMIRQLSRTVLREVTRGLLGVLGVKR